MMTLTPRQAEVLQFLRDFIATKGYPPSVRDVAAWLGIAPNGAECHLRTLERKGVIERTPRISRSIRVLDKCQPTTDSQKRGKLTIDT